MKSSTTFKKFLLKKEGWLTILLITAVFFSSCYEFFLINQPTEAFSNSSFDVSIIVKEDDGGNDWTVADLQDIGLLGVLIPDGWTVTDSIEFSIVSTNPIYNNEGVLAHSTALSAMLEDSIGSPENYHWWGAETTEDADMSYFDSLYFTLTVNTDEKTGSFSLQYSVGDKDYWDRNPSDDLSAAMPIEITENISAINSVENVNFSVYPNPTSDVISIDVDWVKHKLASIQAFDAGGKLVETFNINQSSNSINLSGFQKGVYFLRINTLSGSATQKVLLK